MKKYFLLIAAFIFLNGFSQENDRIILRGKVLYRGVNVPNENVINVETSDVTITNYDGEFEIEVKAGDELVFSAINYKLKTVKITEKIIQRNRLVVEVTEKITELDEVIVGPENEEGYIALKNEEFKQFDYKQDQATEIENYALSQHEAGMKYGLNVIGIFKALLNTIDSQDGGTQRHLKVSEVLRSVYEDDFFITDLKLPQDKINEFLFYCDDKLPAQELLKKENEFELIDFLVNQSQNFLNEPSEEK